MSRGDRRRPRGDTFGYEGLPGPPEVSTVDTSPRPPGRHARGQARRWFRCQAQPDSGGRHRRGGS